MPRTLLDLRNEAERRRAAGRPLEALKVYRLVLEALPLDFDLRVTAADLLAELNADELAAAVYEAIAGHDIKAGNPLRAIVAIKQLEAMSVPVEPLLDALVEYYSVGSPRLGRGVRLAPTDYSAEVREEIDLDYEADPRELARSTAEMAAYTGNIQKYPERVPPVAIFSALEPEPFRKLLGLLRLRRLKVDRNVIRQGEEGDAVYFLARGEVRVVREVKQPDGQSSEAHLARLGPGSLFGEMALVSDEPRGASVICEVSADVLELSRENVEKLSAETAQVAGAMARFTRERMIANLLATNPLFEPFDDAAKKQLLARFTGHEVPRGTIFLEQGNPGTGLYLLLRGRAEVLKWDGGEYVKIAELGPGDAAGEISLLHEEPATATVRTSTPSTLLFLARELFNPLVEAVPDLLAHFARLAQQRLEDTEFKLMRNRVLDDDFVEDLEDLDDEELCDDDIVML